MKHEKSRLTSKYQATIPKEVRKLLLLEQGDDVLFTIENGNVTMRKATALDLEYLASIESTLSEWSSKSDEEGYGNL